ncbi:MAG: NAD(P)/FAD-dependent oxidoreductase [Candidatus ainarchaeum sp.]|nr:NAD(P)/FAD-dependent oxidoreductase [Candidatus ainarchaeum sp.]
MGNETNKYDVIIVGAGPAGIFAAYEFAKSNSKLKILLLDKGSLIEDRKRTEVMTGFGGAGTFSDGKLHFTPVLSHEKMFHLYTKEEYQELINYCEKVLLEFGVEPNYYPKNLEHAKELVTEAQKNNVQLYIRKAIHVGSDKLPIVMKNFANYLKLNNIELKGNCEIEDIIIDNQIVKGVITKNNEQIFAENVILAPGRYNAKWLQELAEKYKLKEIYDKIEVGVRVEFPCSILERFSDELYETVFTMYTPTYDDLIRTFCPCPRGHVAIEQYDGFVCVNGHSNSNHDSNNSNFAFVTEIKLTKPLESTRAYANFIAQGTTLLGSGKPIIQRLKDLKMGRRSTLERITHSHIQPSLKTAVPGDIGMAMPYRIVTNILEGIKMLDKVLPGLDGDSTFLYSPEVKFRSNKILTDKNLETEIKGLFVAGDGAGLAGNIVGAAVTGLIPARQILNKLNK